MFFLKQGWFQKDFYSSKYNSIHNLRACVESASGGYILANNENPYGENEQDLYLWKHTVEL